MPEPVAQTSFAQPELTNGTRHSCSVRPRSIDYWATVLGVRRWEASTPKGQSRRNASRSGTARILPTWPSAVAAP
jgi:hypothetical protein